MPQSRSRIAPSCPSRRTRASVATARSTSGSVSVTRSPRARGWSPLCERGGGREDAVRDGARVEGRVTELREDHVLRLELVRDALAERPLVAHLVQLDAVPRDLVGGRRAAARAGRAEFAPAARALVEPVERDVPWHEQMRA